MTVTVEQDFRDFVVARWGELEPLAHLVTLDGPSARRVTTDALAELHGQWGRLLDEGSPGAATQRAVLAGSLAEAARRGGSGPGPRRGGSGPGPRRGGSGPAHRHGPAGPDDLDPAREADAASDELGVTALLPVLRRAAPLERAVLGADAAWGLDPGRVADLLGMPVQEPADAQVAVRGRLLAAHTAARVAAGWEPAPWALDRDLDDALDLLMAGPGDPPDAVALVDERHRQVHRRSVVLGAGAALAAAAATAWGTQSVMTGVSTGAAPRPVGPGDPAWSMTSSWPARGRLATDPAVTALVAGASPRARLLYADDVASRRVVVTATADTSGARGTLVRMWVGPRGAPAEALVPANLVRDRMMFMDVVPVAVEPGPEDEDGEGAVLLLARPIVLEARYSPLVAYRRGGGEVGRIWTDVSLDDGVATIPIRGTLPPAFRVRLDGYEGGPLGATPLGLATPSPSGPLVESFLEALGPFVAACTGLPVSAVRSSVALEASVPGDALVQAARGETPGRGRVVVAHTRVPSGALLRSIRVAGDGRGEAGPVDVETTRVVSPDATTAPIVTRLPAFDADVSRFLVISPRAARAQLLATTTSTYPASKVTSLRDGTGVLEVADARRAAIYRLVLWDRAGTRLGSWEQVFRRRDPRDLWPRVR